MMQRRAFDFSLALFLVSLLRDIVMTPLLDH